MEHLGFPAQLVLCNAPNGPPLRFGAGLVCVALAGCWSVAATQARPSATMYRLRQVVSEYAICCIHMRQQETLISAEQGVGGPSTALSPHGEQCETLGFEEWAPPA